MNQSGILIYLLLFFAIIYFMMIRPQQKQQKKRQQMINSLEINNRIVTIGGIHGTIKKIKDKTVTIKVADHVEIEILKSAVGSVITEEDEPEKEQDKGKKSDPAMIESSEVKVKED